MTEQLQLRRGTASQVAAFTGAQGEVVVDTTNERLVVQDGATAGGWPAALASRTAVSDAAYSALVTDRLIAYTALTAARIVTLPAAASYPTGARLAIVDESSACSSSKTITVNRAGSDTIDGATSFVIDAAYAGVELESNGSNAWTILSPAPNVIASLVGIGTAPDPNNPLSVYGAAALFNGVNFNVTVNKAGSSDTASFIFEDGFSGRAQMGLNGSDNFSFKVSPNGSSWTTAIALDAATGAPTFANQRTAVSDAAYSALATDRLIAYTALTAARIVSLPAAANFPAGTPLAIIDESGSCSATNTITIARAGSDTIDGGASATLASAYGSLTLESNGANAWTIIGFSAQATPFVLVARNVNLNALGDTPIAVPPLPNGFSRYKVNNVNIMNASTSLTTAKLGIYTAPSQGGYAIIGQTALSTITSSSPNTSGNSDAPSVTTNCLNASTLYVNVGTAQGAAATADVALFVFPLS
ncbi:MAG: hypothetical protein ABR878_01685 [Roseiarcus sp.]|jgi:hypothetical protein